MDSMSGTSSLSLSPSDLMSEERLASESMALWNTWNQELAQVFANLLFEHQRGLHITAFCKVTLMFLNDMIKVWSIHAKASID